MLVFWPNDLVAVIHVFHKIHPKQIEQVETEENKAGKKWREPSTSPQFLGLRLNLTMYYKICSFLLAQTEFGRRWRVETREKKGACWSSHKCSTYSSDTLSALWCLTSSPAHSIHQQVFFMPAVLCPNTFQPHSACTGSLKKNFP